MYYKKLWEKELDDLYSIKNDLENGRFPKNITFKRRGYNVLTLALPSGRNLYPKDETLESVLETINKDIDFYARLIEEVRDKERKYNILENVIKESIGDIIKAGKDLNFSESVIAEYISNYIEKNI
jgi:hypothetical protein